MLPHNTDCMVFNKSARNQSLQSSGKGGTGKGDGKDSDKENGDSDKGGDSKPNGDDTNGNDTSLSSKRFGGQKFAFLKSLKWFEVISSSFLVNIREIDPPMLSRTSLGMSYSKVYWLPVILFQMSLWLFTLENKRRWLEGTPLCAASWSRHWKMLHWK